MDRIESICFLEQQTLVRSGFKELMSTVNEADTIVFLEDMEQLKVHLIGTEPDILVVDYLQGEAFSMKDLQQICAQYPDLRILIISSDDNQDRILKVLEYGVSGYLKKECRQEEIVNAVKAVARGDKFFCNQIIDVILRKKLSPSKPDCDPTTLTERETEITRLIAEGLTNKMIAERLFISHHTVHTHRKNIMKKLGINTSHELTVYALNTGLYKLPK